MTIVVEASQGAATPLPTRLFSARDIAEMSLERVGAFTMMEDDGADPIAMERALRHMEIVSADLAGRKRCQWLIPATVEFDLEDGVSEYALEDIMVSAHPSLGIAYPISAYVASMVYNAKRGSWATATVYAATDLVTHNGLAYVAATAHTSGVFATDLAAVRWTLQPHPNFNEISIIRRSSYERFSDRLTSGTAGEIYISRTNDGKTLLVYPVQSSSGKVRLRIVVQTYPRSVMGPIGESDGSGDMEHGFDRTWQRWLVLATSCEIGDGPVRQLSESKLKRLIAMRDSTETALMGFQNREKVSLRTSRTRRRDW